jgi:hypothetical protein
VIWTVVCEVCDGRQQRRGWAVDTWEIRLKLNQVPCASETMRMVLSSAVEEVLKSSRAVQCRSAEDFTAEARDGPDG